MLSITMPDEKLTDFLVEGDNHIIQKDKAKYISAYGNINMDFFDSFRVIEKWRYTTLVEFYSDKLVIKSPMDNLKLAKYIENCLTEV